MLFAVALLTVLAQPGTTYSGVAAQYGVSVSAVEAVNPYPATDIPIGASIRVPTRDGSSNDSPATPVSSGSTSGGGSSTSGGFQIPGLSASLSNCIAWRESSNGQASWNIFQITPGSGFTVTPGMSVAQQEQVAGQVVAADGAGAWTRFDGC